MLGRTAVSARPGMGRADHRGVDRLSHIARAGSAAGPYKSRWTFLARPKMNKPVLALFLYFGLTLFLVINAISILRGMDVFTGVERGLLALMVFAALGIVAALASNEKAENGEKAAK